MGCCQDSKAVALNHNVFCEKLKEAIDSGSVKRVNMLLDVFNKKKNKEKALIDQEIVRVGNYSLNALGYCCLSNKDKMFNHLVYRGARLEIMESQMESQNLRTINVICLKGHLPMLKLYLPLYMKTTKSSVLSTNSFTIDLNDQGPQPMYDLAIHSACRSGMFQIVSFIFQYFKDLPYTPKEFDIHSTDEGFGEDAGLIACRVGCFPLVKYLHEKCGVDYKRLNKNKENAIMICVSGNKKSPSFSYLECISYLIEIVKLDITYMYQEVLLLAESEEIIKYLETQLEKVGVFEKKTDIDKEKEHRDPKAESNFSFEENFFDRLAKEKFEDNSFVSSISSESKSRCLGSSWIEALEPFKALK